MTMMQGYVIWVTVVVTLLDSTISKVFSTPIQNVVQNSVCRGIKRDCLDLYLDGCREDGVYEIDPTQTRRVIAVFCDMTYNGGGWTVIQRRVDNTTNFFRDFGAYVQGFGHLEGNMFLGLDNIHELTTSSGDHPELYIHMKSFGNEERFAKYSSFYIDGTQDMYKLHISGYYGTAGDSLSYNNNCKFSTYDYDNDKTSSYQCAKRNLGAWWYNACNNHANLNGFYFRGNYAWGSGAPGIIWKAWKGNKYSMKTTIMKVRRHSNLVNRQGK